MADNLNDYIAKGRKRSRNEKLWKANVAKRARNFGEEYVSGLNGKTISKKIFKATNSCCSKKCFEKVNISLQKEMHDSFWKLGDYKLQNVRLSQMIHFSADGDERGGSHNTVLSDDLKKMILDHCLSIKHSKSHYTPSTLMYFQEDGKSKKPLSLSSYSHYFNHFLNFTFNAPRSDVCDICYEFKTKLKPNDTEMKIHQNHLQMKNTYFVLKKQMLQTSENNLCLEFDFGQNLPLPKLPISAQFYCDRNFGYYGKDKKILERIETDNEYLDIIRDSREPPFKIIKLKNGDVLDFEKQIKENCKLPKSLQINILASALPCKLLGISKEKKKMLRGYYDF
ncbi:hypothetical protein ABEB36_015116 [Hypothenemus hampei]|uniref:Uncharacterized protein n=1 Tax=Hypothenemus hampei TaxID=57062 RepID=A0ABD1E0S1_HYPHA